MLVVISNPVHAEDAFRLELKTEISEDGYDEEQLLWHGYENGQPVTFDVDPYTSFWKRFAVGVMSILPIESQL
jgi:putative cardiolipin synthase